MMFDVAGGVIIGLAIFGLFALGVFSIAKDRQFEMEQRAGLADYTKQRLTEAGGWVCILISFMYYYFLLTVRYCCRIINC